MIIRRKVLDTHNEIIIAYVNERVTGVHSDGSLSKIIEGDW